MPCTRNIAIFAWACNFLARETVASHPEIKSDIRDSKPEFLLSWHVGYLNIFPCFS